MSADARIHELFGASSSLGPTRHLRDIPLAATPCAYSETFDGAWAWRRFYTMLEHRRVLGHERREKESQKHFDEEALAAESAEAESAAAEDALEEIYWGGDSVLSDDD